MKSTEGLPETCLSHHRGGWEPPSHHRWHLVSSTCRGQHVSTNDTSINLTLANCSSESITWNSKAPRTCFPVFPATWLQHWMHFSIGYSPLGKVPHNFSQPFSFMEMNPSHQTLKETFKLSFENVDQFLFILLEANAVESRQILQPALPFIGCVSFRKAGFHLDGLVLSSVM